jgi:hypothetical protein
MSVNNNVSKLKQCSLMRRRSNRASQMLGSRGKRKRGRERAAHLHDAFLDKVLDPDAVRVPRFALAIVGEEAEQQGGLERERFRLVVGDEADEGRKEVAAEKVGDEGPLADGRDDDEGELERSVTEGGCRQVRHYGSVLFALTCQGPLSSPAQAVDALGVVRSCKARSIAETRSCPLTETHIFISGVKQSLRWRGATHGKDLVAAVEAACEDVDDIVTLVGVLAREDVAQQGEEGLYTTKRVSLQEVTLSEREATCLDGVGTARVVGFRFFEGSDGMDEEERDVVLFQS